MTSPLSATLRPPTIDELLKVPDDAAASAQLLVPYIMRIDTQLMKIDRLLNAYQPPYDGKLRINWWKKNGKLQPLPVVWKRTKSKRWRGEIVSTKGLSRRVKTQRDFHDYAKENKMLASMAAGLMEKRVAALSLVANLARVINNTKTKNMEQLDANDALLDRHLETAKMGVWDIEQMPEEGV